MRDSFGTYHPVINFGYFCGIIILGMIYNHPLLLGFSFLGALFYAIYLKGKKAAKFFCCLPLPVILISAVLNPLFNHKGVTILFYFRDNPITMEAVLYGLVSGLMFAAIIMWFYCYNEVITSDKFMFIFGRAAPSVSLVFSMVLRFIPKYHAQTKVVVNGQRCIGRNINDGKFTERVRHGMSILSIMTTWALENAIDTADSMKSRGYGLAGRTSFANYRFDARDAVAAVAVSALLILVIAGGILGYNSPSYYPEIYLPEVTALAIVNYIGYFCLCFMPVYLDIKEDMKWQHLRLRV